MLPNSTNLLYEYYQGVWWVYNPLEGIDCYYAIVTFRNARITYRRVWPSFLLIQQVL